MTHDVQDLLQKALALPDHDRAELAGSLLASLDEVADPDVDAAWQQEIARRSAGIQSGQVNTVPWEAVQQKARSLLHGK